MEHPMDSASGQEVASPSPDPPARGSDEDSSEVSLPVGDNTKSRDQRKDDDRKTEIRGEEEGEIKPVIKKSPEEEDARADDGPRQDETPDFPAAPREKQEGQKQEGQKHQEEDEQHQQQRQEEEHTSPSPSSSSSPQSTSHHTQETAPSVSVKETPKAALVPYASPVAHRQPTRTHADTDADDDIETIIPRQPRFVPQGRTSRRPRSLYLPPMPPHHAVLARNYGCASDGTTETETDASSSAHVQSRRRDLGRGLLDRRRSWRSRRGPYLDPFGLDGYESEREDDEAYADGFGPSPGRGAARWRHAHPQDAGYRYGYEYDGGHEDDESNGFGAAYPLRNVQHDLGSYIGPPRRAVSSRLGRRTSGSKQDKVAFDMADGFSAGSNAPDPRGLRREGSVKRANNTSRVDQRTSGNSGMGGSREKGLRLRMDMNLEVEITLKAKIQGGIEFSML